jgi:hypothetical protein
MIITSILVRLAAICNAVMDRIDDENIHDSIWKNSNWAWWYKRESWNQSKQIYGWKFDGWHVFKSLMVIFILAAPLFYSPFFTIFNNSNSNALLDYITLGVIWNVTFRLFYNKIFKLKK